MRGGEARKTPRAASPGGTPEEPGEEGQTRSLVGMRYHSPRAERLVLWERAGFEAANREGKPAPGRAGESWGSKGSRSVGQGRRRRPGRHGEADARAGQGRAGRRRPGNPPALAGEEAAAPGAAPSLPASPAGPRAAVSEAAGCQPGGPAPPPPHPRAGPGRVSPVSRLKEIRASAR